MWLRPRSPCGAGGRNLPGVNVTLETVRGTVESNWTKGDGAGEAGIYSFRVPFGATADVDLPGRRVFAAGAGVHRVEGVVWCGGS